MGHTSGALRSRNFASSARGLRPDGKTPRWWRGSQAVLGGRKKMDALSSHELSITGSQNCLTLHFKQRGLHTFRSRQGGDSC